ncbi:MAG: cell division protein ZapA [Pseudomonadota bacterium]
MSEMAPIKVNILDKEYLISCSEEEREQLRSAVDTLNEKMLEMKNSGSVIGTERIAVMTALNMTHELLAYKQKNQDYTSNIDSTLKRLQSKINNALVRETQLDIEDPISQGS